MEKITLIKPIMINGKSVSEFNYDVDGITSEDFMIADAKSSTALASKGVTNMQVAELNSTLHFYLGCYAIIACDSSIDIEDLKRVSGRDFNKIRKVGQTFFSDTAEEETQKNPSTEKQLEDSSETIAESMEKAPKRSGN